VATPVTRPKKSAPRRRLTLRFKRWKLYALVALAGPLVVLLGVFGYYYVVLSRMIDARIHGDKQRIDSLTSNNGHLLWSGIVADERVPFLVQQLMSNEMFSGWGVRTMATTDRGYNPIGYHTGTVWPHDNSLIVMGLTRYGYREEANRIVTAQIEAAAYTGYRLPENFCGYARSVSRFPVPYPAACSPQAWSTAAPLLYLRSMLGLEAKNGELTVDPVIPAEYGRIAVKGVTAFGARWDLEAVGRTGTVKRAARH